MNKKILGIGNAIVDVIAKTDDEFLKKNNLIKGSMKLINKSEFENLEKKIKIEKVVAGGSVANTMSGIAYLKGSPSFIGKVNSDKFGNLYKKSLEDINVKFPYIKKDESLSTGASIILITPDSERTMCTYLGISSHLSADDISKNSINYDLRKLPFIPNGLVEIFNKIVAKDSDEKVVLISSESKYAHRKSWMSKTQENEYQHPCVYTITQKDGMKFYYSSLNDKGHFGVPKVMWSNGLGTYPIIDETGQYGLMEYFWNMYMEINIKWKTGRTTILAQKTLLLGFTSGVLKKI
jgi:hypothetical protein